MTNYEYQWQSAQPSHSHSFYAPALLSLLPNITNQNGDRLKVLDLGCGNGSLTNVIAQQGFDVTGIEESPSGVAQATKTFPDCQFRQHSLYSPPPVDFLNYFDVVVSSDVIEHLFYPRELPRFAKQCLKPGGQLIVTTPYHGYWKNLALALLNAMDKHHTVLWDGGHIKFFSVKTLSQLLQEEDFTNLQFRFAGRLPYLWKGMLASARLN
ncbi:class I SAM-dependent methyltransferase [Synechocystis sp. FACHB-383]|uniref:class I SAM-dependent methyltransferase n=1 Tax=Synechocystis sp. FACHB-383 TaxID=2692864 RepID=UPI0016851252|nr:class I SAM-dependent methyltransferase [Synechocystis sp. FACHB-383]MBD2654442.1 class I SAM-dependent methyltransferase [Synechocystis sp. FACHB-383]